MACIESTNVVATSVEGSGINIVYGMFVGS